MRYLTVVRHAKAEPIAPGQSDVDRELNKHGRDQCRQLHAWASDPSELGRYGPTVALVSAARRTKETYRRAFKGTPFVRSREYSELIYNGRREVTAQDLLAELASIDPVTSSLLVVAHNPTVADVVAALLSDPPLAVRQGRFPLAGAYVFALRDDEPVALATYELVATYVPD